jgi:hypothetical protein
MSLIETSVKHLGDHYSARMVGFPEVTPFRWQLACVGYPTETLCQSTISCASAVGFFEALTLDLKNEKAPSPMIGERAW